MKVIAAFAHAQIKVSYRVPRALLWSFAFPLVLLLALGGLGIRVAPGPTAGAGTPSYPAFLLMGLIGFNVASIGIFGLGIVIVQYRERGVLRRLAMTPQPAWKFALAQVIGSATLCVAATLVLLVAAMAAYGTGLPRRPAEWLAVLLVGIVTFQALGVALAATVDDMRTAQSIGNVALTFLLVFGGVWWPMDVLPVSVRWIGEVMPLGPFLTLLRDVGVGGRPLASWPLGVLIVWTVVASVFVVRRFRWNYAA